MELLSQGKSVMSTGRFLMTEKSKEVLTQLKPLGFSYVCNRAHL